MTLQTNKNWVYLEYATVLSLHQNDISKYNMSHVIAQLAKHHIPKVK